MRHNGVDLHWEHGYRTHGYWGSDGNQYARIGLPHFRFMKSSSFPYIVVIGQHEIGSFKTLSAAKRFIQTWFRKLT